MSVSVYQEENCCGLVVIGNFYSLTSKDQALNTIKRSIIDYVFDWVDDVKNIVYPDMWMATTTEQDAVNKYAGEALKELGFRGRQFKSVHGKGMYNITLWTKKGLPKGMKRILNTEKRRILREDWESY